MIKSDTSALRTAVAGRYRIEREIGHGGMATVYLADDLRYRRLVAIKVLHPELARAVGSARFLREIQVAAQLSHPHIVPLYDSGEANGSPYLVMPFVDGESLRQRLDRDGPLPIDEAIDIATQISSALEYAHAHGVIHRDIKPENILLFHGEAVLTDFGIALTVTSSAGKRITETGLVLGTPEYMSPEQSLGEGADERSDIYSLAGVVFEMLTGEPPYVGPTAQSIIVKRLSGLSVPSARHLRPSIPPSVDAALAKALAKTPADRFASPLAFASALTAPPEPRSSSVAVLPFINLSGDPDNEYFADGITEDVIAHLSKIHALKVISRASVMPFKPRQQPSKEMAAMLGVTTLLDGTVRRSGDRVRIVATLIDAETEQHLWVETYDRQLSDIFAIQTDVALHIAAAMRAELSPQENTRLRHASTRDVQAYHLYLQGRQWLVRFSPDSLRRAIEFFDRAIQRDPEFAAAFAGNAMAYAELGDQGAMPPAVVYASATEAAVAALRLDPDLAAAHCITAQLKAVREYDWMGAEQEFKRALELNPNSADACDLYGRLCSALERYDEALALVQRAQELDPLAHRLDLATTLLRAGRYDEALASAKNAAELDASDRARATLGWAYFLSGRREQGLAELEHAVSDSPESTMWLGQLGAAYAMAGNEGKARQILQQLAKMALDGYVSPYHLAYVYTGLGEAERALDCLELAVAERTGASYAIKGSFLFTALRDHPRFRALLRRMRLE